MCGWQNVTSVWFSVWFCSLSIVIFTHCSLSLYVLSLLCHSSVCGWCQIDKTGREQAWLSVSETDSTPSLNDMIS